MLNKVRKLIEGPLSKEKITVVDVLLEYENGVKNLVIVIDKKPYVDIDTCVLATNIINPILDKTNLLEDSYVLDVCSKGGE